jgi:hypothetical protein
VRLGADDRVNREQAADRDPRQQAGTPRTRTIVVKLGACTTVITVHCVTAIRRPTRIETRKA